MAAPKYNTVNERCYIAAEVPLHAPESCYHVERDAIMRHQQHTVACHSICRAQMVLNAFGCHWAAHLHHASLPSQPVAAFLQLL